MRLILGHLINNPNRLSHMKQITKLIGFLILHPKLILKFVKADLSFKLAGGSTQKFTQLLK